MDAAGLEISEHSLKYLQFVGGKEQRLGAFGNSDLPEGVIMHGEIQDVAALADALRALLKELGTPRVHVSLPEQKGYIFRMSMPRNPDLTMREAIEFRLEEYIPLPPSDVVFDWEPLSEEEGGAEIAVNVTAFPRAAVEEYYEALASAGFLPLSFEIESQAAARAVLPRASTAPAMIVDFGETRTAIAVAQDGVVQFTTSLELSGGALTASLAKKLGAAPSEAERLKNEEGIVGAGKTTEAIMGTVTALRDEIQRHFVYWHTHSEAAGRPHRPIESIILCGGNANVRGLPAFLSQTVRAKIELADVWQNAFSLSQYVPPIPHNQSLRFATVAGLALRRGILNA